MLEMYHNIKDQLKAVENDLIIEENTKIDTENQIVDEYFTTTKPSDSEIVDLSEKPFSQENTENNKESFENLVLSDQAKLIEDLGLDENNKK
ncbi:UNVERIFIED_CONTAM: hypothetical protein O8I53_11930 [Campylobacter lari]